MHADRMAALGSLAARVGHEMNNPLAFLMANLSFAREEIGRLRRRCATARARGRRRSSTRCSTRWASPGTARSGSR